MGFYNIYKIIKDMIRTLFGKRTLKIIIILIIIMFVIMFLYGSKIYADFSIIDSDTNNTFITNSSYDSNYSYFFTLKRVQNNSGTGNRDFYTYYFFYSNSPFITTNYSNFDEMYFQTVNNTTFYQFTITTYSINRTFDLNNQSPVTRNSRFGPFSDSTSCSIIYSNFDVYDTSNNLVFQSNSFSPPSLSNSISDLENLNFTNFIINANSFTQEMIENPDEPLVLLFYNRSLANSSNTDGLYPIKEKYFYKESIYFDNTNSTDSNYVFSYPIFRSGVFFNIGSTYEIKLAKRVYIEEYNTWGYDFFDNSYVFTVSSNVTQDYINQLNQQTATSTDEDNQQQINNTLNEQTNAINNQTQSIDNINNSITDSAVDNSSINLPTDNTNDPTQSGVDNIFQTIYNSFTTGTPQDIVFPIPFSNNNLVIQANYVSNMLGSTQAGSVIISLIQAYYWYLISRFIITDIMRKVRKIKQGNFENLQNSNIKEDML